jgi:MFS transporter, FSR family, fosmidomycin resistance protein
MCCPKPKLPSYRPCKSNSEASSSKQSFKTKLAPEVVVTINSVSKQPDSNLEQQTFANNRPSVFAIAAAHSSVDMHTGSLAVLLPVLLTSLNLNYTNAAAIITANQIVIAVAQPIFGILGDRKPNRAMIWFGCLLTGLGMASVLWMPNYWAVMVAVILSGLGSAIFHPEAISRSRAVMRDKPATSVSIFFSGGSIGFAVGPILATVLTERWSKFGALLMLVPTGLALVGLASQWRTITASREDVRTTKSGSSARINYPLVWFLILLIAVRGTVSTGLLAFIPLYFKENGQLGPEAAALMVTITSLSGVAGNLLGGTLGDKYGRRVLMASSLVISLAALYGFLNLQGIPQMIAAGIAGASLTAAWPIIVVMIQEAMPGNLGLAGGLSLGTTYAASGLGVGILGAYADISSIAAVMTVLAILPVVSLVLTAFVPERPRALEPT